MKHRILCCTRPGTGSRDSHTCVTNYTYHFWNICGNLKIALGVNPFVSNGEPRLNVPSLLEPGLNMHFSPKIRHILPPCDNCDIWNGEKRVKKFGQPWLTLTVQLFRYCVRVRPKNFLYLSLYFCFVFFIVPRWRLGQDRLRKVKKRVSFIYFPFRSFTQYWAFYTTLENKRTNKQRKTKVTEMALMSAK